MKKLTPVERLLRTMAKAKARRDRAVALYKEYGSYVEVGRRMGISRQRANILVAEGLKG